MDVLKVSISDDCPDCKHIGKPQCFAGLMNKVEKILPEFKESGNG
jgi:hypothetical protein